jgi:hypothetical protein
MHKTFFVSISITLWLAVTAQAVVYNVNRSFTDGVLTATLTGTVSLPVGNHVIQNQGPSPFTNVNLSLTVNSTSYNLVNTLTDLIQGSGQFLINATPTTVTFSTNGISAADLVFSDTTQVFDNNRYVIGTDSTPMFEVAYTNSGDVLAFPTFPVLFGTAVPEPSSVLLCLTAIFATLMRRNKFRYQV